MPQFKERALCETCSVRLATVCCNGRDLPRPVAESLDTTTIVVVLKGRFFFRSKAGRTVADPGTALALHQGEEFEIRHRDAAGDVCLSIQGRLAADLAHSQAPIRRLGTSTYIRLLRHLKRLEAGDCDGLRAEETIAQALGDVLHVGATRPGRDREIVDKILSFMKMNFERALGVSDLAAAAGVSVFHACRAFRRVTGQSMHQYRLDLRTRHAASLLMGARPSLTHIAYELGFANSAHFSNEFRSRIGVTPSKFRSSATSSR
jgi:AraC family transcriptional regulator